MAALHKRVHLLEGFLSTASPAAGSTIVYGPRQPHCWVGPYSLAERLKMMAGYALAGAPKDVDPAWWRMDAR